MDSSGEARSSSTNNQQHVQLPSIRNLVDALPPFAAYRPQRSERSSAFTSPQKQEQVSPLIEQVRPSGIKSFNPSNLSLPPASADRSAYAGAPTSSGEQALTPQVRIRSRVLSNQSVYEYRDNANTEGVASSSQTRGRWITSDPHSATGETTPGGLDSGEPTLAFSARDRGERRETGQGAQTWSSTPPSSRDYRTDLGVYRRDESTARDPFHPRIAIDQTQTAQTTLSAQTPHGLPPPHLPSQPWNHSNLSGHPTGLVAGKHHDFASDRPTSSASTVHISHGSHLSQLSQLSHLSHLSHLSQLSERERVSAAIVNPIDDQRIRSSDSQSQTHQSHHSQSHQSHYHRSVSGAGHDYLTPPWSQSDRNSSPRASTILPAHRESQDETYQDRRQSLQGRETYQSTRDGREHARSRERTEYPKNSNYSEEPDRDRYNPERDRHVVPSGSLTPNTPRTSNRPSEVATYGTRDSRDSRNSYNRSMDYQPHSPLTPLHLRSESSRERGPDYVGQPGHAGYAGHSGRGHAGPAYGRRDSRTGIGSGNGASQNNENSGLSTSMPPPRIPAQSILYGEASAISGHGAKHTGDRRPSVERRSSSTTGSLRMMGTSSPGDTSGRSGRNGSNSPKGPSGHGHSGHGHGHAHKYGTDPYNSSSEQRRQSHQQFAEPPIVSARSQKKRRADGSSDVSDVVNAAGGLAMLAAGVGGRPPAQPTHPGYPVQSGQSAHLAHPNRPSYPTQHSTHSSHSPYPTHPAQSSQTAQSTHPSDAIHPVLAGLLRQRSKEDLPRALRELSEEAQRALADGRVMKTINEYSRTIARFSEFLVRAKGSVVATPEQAKEMSHRAVLICRMARDLKARILAKKRLTEEAKQQAAVPTPLIRQTPAKKMTKQQIKDMKKIRKKRDSAQQGIKGKYTKRNKKTPAPKKCSSCGIKETPEWRKGPEGPRTLCNACGLHYAKLMKNRETNDGKWIGPGTQPTIDIVTLRQATGVGIQPQINERGEVEIPGVLINIPRANLLKEPLRIGAKPPTPPLPIQRLPASTGVATSTSTTSTSTSTSTYATSTSTPSTGNVSSTTPTAPQIQPQPQPQPQAETQTSAQEVREAHATEATGAASGSRESTEMMEATPTTVPAESSQQIQQTPRSSHMDVDSSELRATPATPRTMAGTVEPPTSSPSVSSRKRKAVSDDEGDGEGRSGAMGMGHTEERGGDTGQPAGKKRRKSSPQVSQSHTVHTFSDVPVSPNSPNGSHESGATTPTQTQTQTQTAMAHSPLPAAPPPLTPHVSMDSMDSMASDT